MSLLVSLASTLGVAGVFTGVGLLFNKALGYDPESLNMQAKEAQKNKEFEQKVSEYKLLHEATPSYIQRTNAALQQ